MVERRCNSRHVVRTSQLQTTREVRTHRRRGTSRPNWRPCRSSCSGLERLPCTLLVMLGLLRLAGPIGAPEEGDHHPVLATRPQARWWRHGSDGVWMTLHPPRVWIKIEVEIKIQEIGGSWLPPRLHLRRWGCLCPSALDRGDVCLVIFFVDPLPDRICADTRSVLCCAVDQTMRTRWSDARSSNLVPGRRRGSKIQEPAGANAAFGYTALLPLRRRREHGAINAVLQALMEPGG